jgi:hypothetical protein
MKYTIDHGNLVIRDINSHNVVWSGKPKGIDVIGALPIEFSDDCIVLLDWRYSEKHRIINLLRINSTGKIIWEVDHSLKKQYSLPHEEEFKIYTDVWFEKPNLVAYAASGFADYIDLQNGKIIKTYFVK